MRILLVEDDSRLARSYRRNLEDEGYRVEVAGDAETAYDRLCQAPDIADVLIFDVLLPGRNGIQLCRDLRRDGLATPILLLTALDQTEDKVAGLDAGADDYLTKPFPMDELMARVRALGRRSARFDPAATQTRLRAGDVVVDLARHEVTRRGEPVRLTVREFALLELLVRNANRVLTRDQLTDSVWPDGTEAGSNVLDTYIHFLRDKLDRDEDDKLIHTVRGVGYILRVKQEEPER